MTDTSELRRAIELGLQSFCSAEPDFSLSAAMRQTVADHILAQPELFAVLDAKDALIAELVGTLGEAATWLDNYASQHFASAEVAQSGREQHSHEIKGTLYRSRAQRLNAFLSKAREAMK